MYRFIKGGSGSGKTYRALTDCISASLRSGGSRFFVIVPEQATTEAEREIVRLHPAHATDQIEVLSFQRLAYTVFDELNLPEPDVLNDIRKAMILRRLACESGEQLVVWKNRFDKPGFIDHLKSMISELYQYGIVPEQLEMTAADGISSNLRGKLHDLALLYRRFREYIAERYLTPEEVPDVLARVLPQSSLLRGATIVLDGFTGFTPVQYRILESFLTCASEVIITVSIGEDEKNDLFEMPREMMHRIIDLASRNGIRHGEDVALHRDSFMEKHLLRYDGAQTTEDCGQCRIVQARNLSEEVEFVAVDIERAVKTQGLRYREIAVILGDPESSQAALRHELDLSGIPYYDDESIGLVENALTAMIEAALDVADSGYSAEALLRYVKTGLVSDDAEMIAVLENYMLECGKRGYRKMREDWDYEPADLKGQDRMPALNALKKELLDGLEPLRSMDVFSAIRQICARNRVEEKLEQKQTYFRDRGDARREREYKAAYPAIMDLLDGMEDLLQGQSVSLREFAAIFAAGVSQIKLGMIPSGVDRITLGDLTRTRLEHVRRLYVLGANEGNIPRVITHGSVLTDTEKEILKMRGALELAPTVKEDLRNQRYYVYRLFNKPEEQLVLSYSLSGAGGEAMKESFLIRHLRDLYPKLSVENADRERKEVFDENHGLRRLSENLGKLGDPRFSGAQETEKLYAYFLNRESSYARVRLITEGALYRYHPEKLSAESLQVLYPGDPVISVTQLERFGECHYAYFLRYGLHLRELRKFSVEAVDLGNLAHTTLEYVFTAAGRRGLELEHLSDSERDALVDECLSAAVLDDAAARYSDTSRNRYLTRRLARIVKRSLWAMLRESGSSGYIPYALEWEFRNRSIELDSGRRLRLEGKVDRIDLLAEEDGSLKARVLDYKTGSKSWDWSEVMNGHDLQLALYMDAAGDLLRQRFPDRPVHAGAMMYFHLQDPFIEPDGRHDPEDLLYREMQPTGIWEPELIDQTVSYVKQQARTMGQEILSGDITVRPRKKGNQKDSCTWCPYRAVCGFDTKLRGFRYQGEPKYKADEAREIVGNQVVGTTEESH